MNRSQTRDKLWNGENEDALVTKYKISWLWDKHGENQTTDLQRNIIVAWAAFGP